MQVHDRYRFAAAVFGGLVLASAFPLIGVAGLAWVAPGLMLLPALGVDGRMAFRLGYVAGLAHFLASLYWLLHIPVFKLAPITGWLALSGFLSVYAGLWVWLSWRMFPVRLHSATGDLFVAMDRFLEVNWGRRVLWAMTCAALWVTWEMTQARLLSGFPWNLLGASQFKMVPIIQIASVTGVYGVSFLAVWFAVSFLMAAVVVVRRSNRPRQWMWEIILPMLVLTLVIALGYRKSFATLPAPDVRTVKLALIQPSIPQQWIWSSDESSNRFEQLIALSQESIASKPDVIVWPEAAVPGFVRWTTNTQSGVASLARSNRVWVILGADDAAPRGGFSDEYDVFNASFLVSPRGEFVERYAKRNLVMFGEYIPLARWLPFLERWTGMGSFTPGKGPVPFAVPEPGFKTSVLICFEDVFPHLAREYVEEDTDFLLNLTNNGWFGESAAQWQHAAAAVFRAVENGLPLVRCANNGLTCLVDASGRMQAVFFEGSQDIYRRGIKVVEVPLLSGRRRAPTFYRRYGDLFGWSCVAVSLLALGLSRLRPSRPVAQGSGGDDRHF